MGSGLATNGKPSRIPPGEDACVFLDSMPVSRSWDSSVMWEMQNKIAREMDEGRNIPAMKQACKETPDCWFHQVPHGFQRWNLELAWIESLSSLRNSGSQVPVRIEFRMGSSRVELGESKSADSGLRSLIFQCLIF